MSSSKFEPVSGISSASVTRRRFLRNSALAIGAVSVPGLLAACGPDEASPTTSAGPGAGESPYDISGRVIYADYGGTTRQHSQTAFYIPFENETGVPVVPADIDTARLQLFVESGEAEWDLMNLDGFETVLFSREGYLQELPDWVRRTDLVPEEYQKWGTGNYAASVGIGYLAKEGMPVPNSWADFWDTSNFPGQRGLPSWGYLQPEAALLADGVPHDEIYPIDFDRAFAKMDELRDHILYWDTFAQSTQYLAQESVSMTLSTNSRTLLFRDQGFPVEHVWNESMLLGWGVNGIPKNPPNPDAAFALADYAADPQRQATFSRLTYYGPTTSAAFDLMSDELLAQLPNSPQNLEIAFAPDIEARAEANTEIVERWTEWVAG